MWNMQWVLSPYQEWLLIITKSFKTCIILNDFAFPKNIFLYDLRVNAKLDFANTHYISIYVCML